MTRDFVYGRDATFLVDLPDGAYDVTPTLGDAVLARDGISVWLEGQQVDTGLASAPGQVLKPTYHVQVTGGQLSLRLVDDGGVDPYFSINGLAITPATGVIAAPSGLTASAVSASGVNLTWSNHADDQTGTEIQRSTDGSNFSPLAFVGAGVTTFSDTGLSAASAYAYRVRALTPAGTSGFSATAAAPSAGRRFAFGPSGSPAPSGYTVATAAAYSSATGSGWDPASAVYDDRRWGAIPSPLTAGFVYGRDATFLVDLPDGAYDVTPTLGDALVGRDAVAVYAQGQLVASAVTTAAGQAARPTFRVQVSGGRLALRVVDQGGADPYFALDTLDIVPAGPAAALPTPTALQATASSPNEVDLTWTNNGGGQTGTAIERSTDGTHFTRVASATQGVSSFDDTGLSPGTTYSYRVYAISQDGSSPASGAVTVTTPAVTSVTIDTAWLAARGSGPYVLDQSGVTYTLVTDVHAKGTGFVVTAPHVTLDLNGHTVVYDDSAPVTVPNGDFEGGTGSSVPGWDLSGASSASLAANTNYLFGNQVLRLSSFSTPQRVVSGAIAIPEAGRSYAATITPAAGNYASTLTLSVIDTVTGQVLARGVSRSVSRGISAVASFVPTTTNPVRLQVDVVPPAGQADTLDIDEATVAYAYDSGVVATNAPADEVLALPGLPPTARSTYKGAADFTLKNGSLIQGAGLGYAATPMFFKDIPGVTVDGVTASVSGVDSVGIDADGATVGVTVRNTTIREQIPNITDRLQDFAAIALNGVSGTIDVVGNHLLGAPQIGIMVTNNDPAYRVTIKDNEIRHRALVTNGYGLVIEGLSNFEVAGNTIVTASGRGIDVDGYGLQPTSNGTIHDNYVSVQEGPNREEGTDGSARALRMRNNVDAEGAHLNVRVSNNTFVATTGPGLMRTAFGGRIDYVNGRGQMNNAGVVIENNLFKAVVTTDDDGYHAQALDVDGVDPGIHLRISGNTLESNDLSLALGGSDQGPVSDVVLISNTVRKSSDGAARPYTGIRAGYWIYEIHNVSLIDARAENGATTDIEWSGSGAKDIETGWLLDVRVVDVTGAPIPGASVTLTDAYGTEFASGVTDTTGLLASLPLITTIYQQLGSDPAAITSTRRGPFQLRVSSGLRSTVSYISLGANSSVTSVLA